MIKEESIEALKARLDIVDVVGSYVELKKAGAYFKGLCPFHGEKTPSFTVSPGRQTYHCFGCGVHGDPIRFVMELEKLSYPEAIEKLAGEYNVALEYTTGKPKTDIRPLEQLNDYFKKRLDQNPEARAYIHDRGIHESSAETFEIGWAPSSGEQMAFFQKQGIPLPAALEVGAAYTGDRGGAIARFIDRVTFPIYSASGKIVGFGGRTMGNHPAKYVNSPQTKLFNKSRLLYAYHIARESIFKSNEVIITEGYLDVIMLHQAGFTNAVATLGTALTPSHLPLLKKGEPKIILAYDGDSAGQDAAMKAATLLSTRGFEGGVVLFEGGMDPADMVKNGQIPQLRKLFSHPTPLIPFILKTLAGQYDLNIPEKKQQAFYTLQNYLKELNPILQEEYREEAARILGVRRELFRFSSKEKTVPMTTGDRRDTFEMSVLKTVLETPELLDMIIDYVDPDVFGNHRDLFDLLLQGEKEDSRLQGILMMDEVKIFSEEELRRELLNHLILAYEKESLRVKNEPLDFKTKAFYLRQAQENIARLKKGEWIPFKPFKTSH